MEERRGRIVRTDSVDVDNGRLVEDRREKEEMEMREIERRIEVTEDVLKVVIKARREIERLRARVEELERKKGA